MMRYRRFFSARRWCASRSGPSKYKPVTEYVRRGTNNDPNAKKPPAKEIHGPKPPGKVGDKFEMAQ